MVDTAQKYPLNLAFTVNDTRFLQHLINAKGTPSDLEA